MTHVMAMSMAMVMVNNFTFDAGVPMGIRTEDGTSLDMEAIINKSLKDDQHVWIVLRGIVNHDDGYDDATIVVMVIESHHVLMFVCRWANTNTYKQQHWDGLIVIVYLYNRVLH